MMPPLLFMVRLLQNPLTILTCMVIGLFLGVYFPDLGKALGPFGEVYVNLLKLTVLPIIITSVALSFLNLLKSELRKRAGFILTTLFLLSLMACLSGLLVAVFMEPGYNIDPTSSPTLKSVVESASRVERGLAEPIEPSIEKGIHIFLGQAIPDNIFTALAQSKLFQMVIFSMLFGIALALVSKRHQKVFLPLLESTLDVFQQIFGAVTVPLALAVICLMARDATLIGADTLLAMAGFVSEITIGLHWDVALYVVAVSFARPFVNRVWLTKML